MGVLCCPCCGAPMNDPNDPYDAILEQFYRSRMNKKQYPPMNLRRFAQEKNIPYSTLTKRKMAYDRAGKWGAKKKAEV